MDRRSIYTTTVTYICLVLSLLIISPPPSASGARRRSGWPRPAPAPCKTFTVYFHDLLYDGHNADNSTSAIVGMPAWTNNKTGLGPYMHFGDLVVFDDPLTADNRLTSPPVGRVQGVYAWDKKTVWSAWFAWTFTFNHTDYGVGTVTVVGADPVQKFRDMPVVGGTGDFLLARGTATIQTDEFQGDYYFRLKINFKFYESCYY